MLAYSAQDLILEPFAGAVFGYSPGESTQLAGLQHGGAFAGMLLAAFAGSRLAGRQLGSLRSWTIGGCLASALTLAGLAGALGVSRQQAADAAGGALERLLDRTRPAPAPLPRNPQSAATPGG